jgi:Zn-finger domain-containing protein
MLKVLFSFTALLWVPMYAGMLISPNEAMLHTFGNDAHITKKNILLDKQQSEQISQKARTKLTTRVYRTFVIRQGDAITGHAVLLNETVRTKNAAVLYMIDAHGRIRTIEVIAFNEPPEYLPSHVWRGQFEGKDSTHELRVGKDIPTITGATMSARNIADGSRVAMALYDVVLNP